MAGRHHCVSQFHLREFVDPDSVGSPDPWLWIGDRGQGTVARRSPSNTGWRRGLFDGQGGFKDVEITIERHLSTEVEGPAARALRDWIRRPQGQRSPVPPELFRYLAWAAVMAQTTVEFLVPEAVTIDNAKTLVVTSGSTKKTEVGDCKSGSFPVQNAMLLDPSGGSAPKRLLAGFVPLGDASAPGTRLGSISGGGLCGPGYRRFTGTAE